MKNKIIENKKILTIVLSVVILIFCGIGVKYITSPKYKIKKIANEYMESLKKGVPKVLLLANGIETKLDVNVVDSYELTDSRFTTDGLKDDATLMGILTYKLKIDGKTKISTLVINDSGETEKFLIQYVITP